MNIVSSQRAINLILAGKALSIDDSEHVMRGSTTTMNIPYVIRMNYFIKKATQFKDVPFSRKGVMVRDNYRCAYCGKTATTIDHIVPKSKGGLNSYENCVACCFKCNSSKGHKNLYETEHKLLIKPSKPNLYSSFLLRAVHQEDVYKSWSSYIFMYAPDLEQSLNVILKSRMS